MGRDTRKDWAQRLGPMLTEINIGLRQKHNRFLVASEEQKHEIDRRIALAEENIDEIEKLITETKVWLARVSPRITQDSYLQAQMDHRNEQIIKSNLDELWRALEDVTSYLDPHSYPNSSPQYQTQEFESALERVAATLLRLKDGFK